MKISSKELENSEDMGICTSKTDASVTVAPVSPRQPPKTHVVSPPIHPPFLYHPIKMPINEVAAVHRELL